MLRLLPYRVSKLFSVGMEDTYSAVENRIRFFFNQIIFFGGVMTLFQAVLFLWIDVVSAVSMFTASLSCFVALYIHEKKYFLFAKLLSSSVVLIVGGIASMRIGSEYLFHFFSLTVVIAFLITFTRKEWLYTIILLLVELIIVLLVESNVFRVEGLVLPPMWTVRVFVIVGTLSFIVYEVLFVARLSESSENHIESKLSETTKVVAVQNDEMVVMIQEIHHRVKNNLQIIISLLRLKMHELEDPKQCELFDDVIDRIQSIALLHQKLYQTTTISELDIEDYLQSLTSSLVGSYAMDKNINVDVKSNVKEINNDNITCFALILNELVSNSLKHAFREKVTGDIIVKVMKEGGQVVLEYTDSGVWKEGVEDSFGLSLIELLTEQLSGEVELNKTPAGSEYRFVFNELV